MLSLSPGPASVEKAWHLSQNANMWRITNDFWDDWALLKNMFTRCEIWQSHVGPGCWPDCDMLPLGRIGVRFGQPRQTRFTPDEQKTLLTLWSIFRSPLILGAELPSLDEATLRLLTNRDVLRLNRHSFGARQDRPGTTRTPVWVSQDEDGSRYAALFNLSEKPPGGVAGSPGAGGRDLCLAGSFGPAKNALPKRHFPVSSNLTAPGCSAARNAEKQACLFQTGLFSFHPRPRIASRSCSGAVMGRRP